MPFHFQDHETKMELTAFQTCQHYLKKLSILFLDAEASSRLVPTITTQQSLTTKTNYDHQNYQNDDHHVVNANRDQYPTVELDLDKDYSEEDWSKNALDRGPFFELSGAKNITAIAGHTAYLNCRVRNLGNKTVSNKFSSFPHENNKREEKKSFKSTQLCTSSYLRSDKNNLWLFFSLQKAFSLLKISCS